MRSLNPSIARLTLIIGWLSAMVFGPLMFTSENSIAKTKKVSTQRTSALDTIRGIIKPAVSATISSDIQARITHLPFKDGQRFKKGQTLVRFDCDKYKAELDAARAEHEAREKTLENNLELSTLNAIGQLEVDIAKVDAKKSKAAINIAQINVQHCQIQAPFSGRIVKVLVHQYESVNPYDELLSILNDSRFEIELILPSSSISWLKKGMSFQFTVDETEKTHAAKITELGASIDPVSQTIRISGAFKKKPKAVLSGMSGSATFPKKPQKIANKKEPKKKTKPKRNSRRTKKPKLLSTIKQK